jgi:hypothetical protein
MCDTHYTERYPLRTHPRRYPLHRVIPIPRVLRTHPRVHPLHWGTLFSSQIDRTLNDTPDTVWYPLHWEIPITNTPKRIPITLSDTRYGHTQEDTHYTEWYPYPEFSEPTQEFTHYTEGPCFPHKQTRHWVIPMTLRDTPDTEWYPLPWVLANRIWLGKDCCLAEFQHFILRCIKISLLCGYHWKRG